MITLFSGVPGSGKTAAIVSLLLKDYKDRPLYVINLDDLLLPHIELKDPLSWMTDCPDGSLVVIDEVQQYWRATGSAAAVHESIKQLEVHRHRGFDFIIATQRPSLIHSNVRGLVGRHIHLRNVGILGRHWYEWPECNDSPNTAWKNAPIKHRYKLPKEAFKYYKSASLHIKPKFGFPRALIVAVAAIAGALYLGNSLYSSLSKKTNPVNPVSTTANAPQPTNSPIIKTSMPDETIDFIPRVYNRPWTAPAYDHLRMVVNMPRITSAICVNKKCECRDGQDRLDMSDEQCYEWATKRPFNPYVPRAEISNTAQHNQTPQPVQHQPITNVFKE